MVATASLWLQHHLGFQFKTLWVVMAGGGISALVSKLAGWMGVKPAVGGFVDLQVRTRLRAVLYHSARPGPLRIIGGTLAVLMVFLSSVTVQSDLPDDRGAVSIVPLQGGGKPRIKSLRPGRPVRFLPVVTSPFGRAFKIDADGYLPGSVTVYSLISRQVLLGRDITPAPSVLFRPFEEGAIALLGRGTFRVTLLRNGAEEVVATDSGHSASFVLGRPAAVTPAMLGLWSLELDAVPVKPEPKAQLLMLWRLPRLLTTDHKLAPNDHLVAEIVVRGKVRSRAEVTLSAGPLIDVLMRDISPDAKVVPPC